MADADKQAGTSVEGAGVTLIVLVALGCLYFSHREPRLLSSLAAMTEVSIIAPAAAQKVDVRSWEDPFAAVARSLDKFGKDELAKCPTPTTAAAIASDRSVCNSPLMNLNKETLVIGVTMSGAPYAEDAERRRRTRYAVLAGLDQAEFMPKDARHLGYFLWTQPDIEHTVVPVPYQWFEKAPSQNQAATFQRILVLWLDEDAFNDHPLQKLSALKQFVFNNNEESDDENLNIIGPYSSDTLRDMVGEIEQQCVTASSHEKCKNADYFNLKNVHFYAYGASASDHWLLQNSMDNFSSV